MRTLIYIGAALLVGAWFVLVDRPSFFEKIMIIVVVAGLYVGFRFMTGATLGEIIAPFLLRNVGTD